MSYREHAMREFKAAGWVDSDGNWSDDMQEMLCKQVLELVEVFSKYGHSGSSAPYALNLFKKIALFKPIAPLTGEDDEWTEVIEGTWQNKRCSTVFKDDTGVYNSEGRVFVDKDGSAYTSKDSRVKIEFPYTPTTEYVNEEIEAECNLEEAKGEV